MIIELKKVAPLTSAFNMSKMESDWYAKLRTIIARLNAGIYNFNDLQSQVDETNEKLSALTDRVTTAEENIVDLTNRMETAEGKITTLEGNVEQLRSDVDALTLRVTKNEEDIAAINAEIVVINGKIDAINEQIAVINSKLENHEERITTNEGNITDLQTRMTEEEAKSVKFREDIDALTAELTEFEKDMHNEIDGLKAMDQSIMNNITAIQATVTGIQNTIGSLQHNYDELRDRVVNLEDHDTTIDSEIATIKETLSVATDLVNRMKDGENGYVWTATTAHPDGEWVLPEGHDYGVRITSLEGRMTNAEGRLDDQRAAIQGNTNNIDSLNDEMQAVRVEQDDQNHKITSVEAWAEKYQLLDHELKQGTGNGEVFTSTTDHPEGTWKTPDTSATDALGDRVTELESTTSALDQEVKELGTLATTANTNALDAKSTATTANTKAETAIEDAAGAEAKAETAMQEVDAVKGMFAGGTDGQVFTSTTANPTGEWKDASGGLPSTIGHDIGSVLTLVDDSGNTHPEWKIMESSVYSKGFMLVEQADGYSGDTIVLNPVDRSGNELTGITEDSLLYTVTACGFGIGATLSIGEESVNIDINLPFNEFIPYNSNGGRINIEVPYIYQLQGNSYPITLIISADYSITGFNSQTVKLSGPIIFNVVAINNNPNLLKDFNIELKAGTLKTYTIGQSGSKNIVCYKLV